MKVYVDRDTGKGSKLSTYHVPEGTTAGEMFARATDRPDAEFIIRLRRNKDLPRAVAAAEALQEGDELTLRPAPRRKQPAPPAT